MAGGGEGGVAGPSFPGRGTGATEPNLAKKRARWPDTRAGQVTVTGEGGRRKKRAHVRAP